jgi:hypothetical protein
MTAQIRKLLAAAAGAVGSAIRGRRRRSSMDARPAAPAGPQVDSQSAWESYPEVAEGAD